MPSRPLRFILAALLAPGLLNGCVSSRNQTFAPVMAQVEADGDAQQKLELPPKEGAKACLAAAQMLEKNHKWTEAAAEYERARELNSAHSYVCRKLAVLYDRLGNFEKADAEYGKALVMFPDDVALLNDAGYSQYCRGNWARAEDYLQQAVQIQPDHKRAWSNLGMTLVMRERTEEALQAFSHVVAEPLAHCNVAFAYTLQGKRQEAMAEYRKAIELAPDLGFAREALAKLEQPNAVKPPVESPEALATSEMPVSSAKNSPGQNVSTGGFASQREE